MAYKKKFLSEVAYSLVILDTTFFIVFLLSKIKNWPNLGPFLNVNGLPAKKSGISASKEGKNRKLVKSIKLMTQAIFL